MGFERGFRSRHNSPVAGTIHYGDAGQKGQFLLQELPLRTAPIRLSVALRVA
jgi:hypothetical protein